MSFLVSFLVWISPQIQSDKLTSLQGNPGKGSNSWWEQGQETWPVRYVWRITNQMRWDPRMPQGAQRAGGVTHRKGVVPCSSAQVHLPPSLTGQEKLMRSNVWKALCHPEGTQQRLESLLMYFRISLCITIHISISERFQISHASVPDNERARQGPFMSVNKAQIFWKKLKNSDSFDNSQK